MIADPLPIRGATILREVEHSDDRGAFRRIVDRADLLELGLDADIAQVSCASNTRRGTLRGLHYQIEPHGESKTIWCNAGSVYDVIVDLRPDEPTYGKWVAVELRADEPVALHVPRGVAHGYQTLEANSSLTYLISTAFVADAARSLLWSDRTVGIEWPLEVLSISKRDAEAPSWPPVQ